MAYSNYREVSNLVGVSGLGSHLIEDLMGRKMNYDATVR